ncbi:MAG: PEP-CTERM sorting domain-containing protein [Bryobacter sp.]|nr:PEP-CTERM sorting domain-containing protein [Bryobacter sp.]
MALTILLTSVAAEAAILEIYSDRATWEADLSGSATTYAFNGSALNTTSAGLSESGTSFVGFYNEGTSGYFTYRIDQASISIPAINLASYGFFILGGGSTSTSGFNGGLMVDPVSGVTSLGFDFGAFALDGFDNVVNNTSATTFRINIFEDGILAQTVDVSGANRPNLAFFGVSTSGQITGVEVLTNNIGSAGYTTRIVLDNYSFGQTALTSGGGDPPPGGGDPGTELPEPSTYAMAGLGLLALVYFRRRAKASGAEN